MLKRGGPVLFNEEVSDPGRTVAWNQAEKKEPPTSGSNEVDDQRDSYCGAEQVEQTRRRPAMFVYIVGPEVCERMECF